MLIATYTWLFTVTLFIDSDQKHTTNVAIKKHCETFLLNRRIAFLT